MATMKAIKKRISSVNNTKKIMKAMDLVAASKLQKAKSRLEDIRPLYDNIKHVMDGIRAGIRPGSEIPFAEEREEVSSIAYIVLTSDRGLCGGYNANVSKEALRLINENADVRENLLTVGSKGLEYFKRRGKNVVFKCAGASEATTFENAEDIGEIISSMYTEGEVDEVYLIYTHFESVLAHEPCIEKLLPIHAGQRNDDEKKIEMDYDPDINTFISYAVPMYLNVTIFGAMIESAVCEYASRMTSMDSATRNAGDIIEDLTLVYNRKRQGMITQEITEIVSGANALK